MLPEELDLRTPRKGLSRARESNPLPSELATNQAQHLRKGRSPDQERQARRPGDSNPSSAASAKQTFERVGGRSPPNWARKV